MIRKPFDEAAIKQLSISFALMYPWSWSILAQAGIMNLRQEVLSIARLVLAAQAQVAGRQRQNLWHLVLCVMAYVILHPCCYQL